MRHRSLIRWFVLVAMLALVAGPIQVGAQATPAATPGTPAGTSGDSYQSANFGFAITWDSSWQKEKSTTDTGRDTLELTNGTMDVYIEGYESSAKTNTEALQAAAQALASEDGVSNFAMASDNATPVTGGSDDSAFALFYLDVTTDSGQTVQLAEYVAAWVVVPGQLVVQVTGVIPRDDVADQLPELAKLVSNLTITVPATPEPGTPTAEGTETALPAADLSTFIQQAEADIDNFWQGEFPNLSQGKAYTPPKAYKDYVQEISTPCGDYTPGAIGKGGGPFLCAGDDTVYVDMLFAQNQADQYGGPFVVAAALAHEVGHHVQALLGLKTCEQAPCLDPSQVTSLELETMADCFAGAWSQDAEQRNLLGQFDIEKNIAEYVLALGDVGAVTADPGVHGRGALRTYWFLQGYYFGATSCLDASQATSTHTGQ